MRFDHYTGPWRLGSLSFLCFLVGLIAIATPSTAQGQHAITVSNESALPGSTVSSRVLLDNPEPDRFGTDYLTT